MVGSQQETGHLWIFCYQYWKLNNNRRTSVLLCFIISSYSAPLLTACTGMYSFSYFDWHWPNTSRKSTQCKRQSSVVAMAFFWHDIEHTDDADFFNLLGRQRFSWLISTVNERTLKIILICCFFMHQDYYDPFHYNAYRITWSIINNSDGVCMLIS